MEGPSLVILTEEAAAFVNKKILSVEGNSSENIQRIAGQRILAFRSWGKHFLIQFEGFSLRIHFLMFGSYRINEKKPDKMPRLSCIFKHGEINFYTCSVKFIEEDLDKIYDWKIDIMSPGWDKKLVLKKVKEQSEEMVCDVLMDQTIFAGVGNIIKNEVLFNLHMAPETLVKNLTLKQQKDLIDEARAYSFKFYEWKRIYQLRKNFLIYGKRKCSRCGVPITKIKTGKGQRRSFFCTMCQH
jgi:endonuclease-8